MQADKYGLENINVGLSHIDTKFIHLKICAIQPARLNVPCGTLDGVFRLEPEHSNAKKVRSPPDVPPGTLSSFFCTAFSRDAQA
jgi:hypothetical protein